MSVSRVGGAHVGLVVHDVDEEDPREAIVGDDGGQVVKGCDERAARDGGVYANLLKEHRDDGADEGGDEHCDHEGDGNAGGNREGHVPGLGLREVEVESGEREGGGA